MNEWVEDVLSVRRSSGTILCLLCVADDRRMCRLVPITASVADGMKVIAGAAELSALRRDG